MEINPQLTPYKLNSDKLCQLIWSEEPFIKNPDKSSLSKPETSLLRQYWRDVNSALASHFNKLTPDEWLQKHASISEEDFAKEPHRNKLSVLLNRTNHLSYHYGQLAFLKK